MKDCRLKFCLTILETKGLRGDLIELFKIFNGFGDVSSDIFQKTFFKRNKKYNLRGNSVMIS